ncbi:hypothetical protein XENTR_v10022589 [Xenopus tropicalis]|nr:hypothetical protein XENTR_v10022589 [Xenopus tropicalis]
MLCFTGFTRRSLALEALYPSQVLLQPYNRLGPGETGASWAFNWLGKVTLLRSGPGTDSPAKEALQLWQISN